MPALTHRKKRVLRWRIIQSINDLRGSRSSLYFHTVTAVSKYLIVFGGYPSQGTRLSPFFFDRNLQQWTRSVVKDAPPDRYSHTTTLVDDKLIVFGGTRGSNVMSDIHVYDLALKNWTEISARGRIPALFGHTAHLVEDIRKVLIVCGRNESRTGCSEHVFTFDPDTAKLSKCKAKGTSPQCAFHGSCMAGRKIYIVGGIPNLIPGSSKLSVFDFSLGFAQCAWSQVRVVGAPATGHVGPAIGHVGPVLMYVRPGKFLQLGGTTLRGDNNWGFLRWFDLENKTVSLIQSRKAGDITCKGLGPSARRNFGFARLHDKVLVFGGVKQPCNQIYQLDISPLL